MNAPVVQFDAQAHIYTVGGRVIPSVTQVLADLSAREYAYVDRSTMDRAAALGTAVHRLIELDLADDLDEDDLTESLVPYLDAWRAFIALSGFVSVLSESRVHSARYGYAGTLDLFGILDGEAVLIDAKRTAQVPRIAGPQTAAYELALRECRPDVVKRATAGRISRFALHLQPDRKWRLIPFTDTNDQRVFLSALTLHHWSKAA